MAGVKESKWSVIRLEWFSESDTVLADYINALREGDDAPDFDAELAKERGK